MTDTSKATARPLADRWRYSTPAEYSRLKLVERLAEELADMETHDYPHDKRISKARELQAAIGGK